MDIGNISASAKSFNKSYSSRKPLLDNSTGSFLTNNLSSVSLKTPTSKGNRSKTSSGSKSLNKSGNKKYTGDRFIPDRSNFEMANYVLSQPPTTESDRSESSSQGSQDSTSGQGKKDTKYSRSVTEALLGVSDLSKTRVLSYAKKPKGPPEGYQNALKVVYQGSSGVNDNFQKFRVIPKCSEKILDAPDIVDDFYLNIIAWSRLNVIAVALKDSVYLWDAQSADIQRLPCDTAAKERFGIITSVEWIETGTHLAVALDNGKIQLWDVQKMKVVRTLKTDDTSRIAAMSVNSHLLTCGNKVGTIRNHDLREKEHEIFTNKTAHSQEVCGLKWSCDGRYYASGGNDNILNIWDSLHMSSTATPISSFDEHVAAVKAIAWNPSHSCIVASGGGTNDRQIKIWNVSSGKLQRTVDAQSQVSGLIWQDCYREIISSHGYSKNQLSLWKYPEMTKVGEMAGHTHRILQMVISPDETTVATTSADETLRFWRAFPPTKATSALRKNKEKSSFTGFLGLR